MKVKKILIVLVPSFDPQMGGVQMTTYKLAHYFATSGCEVSMFSFGNTGHSFPDFAKLYHARLPGSNYNQENVAYCSEVVLNVKPQVVINQMPYEHNIGAVLKQAKNKLNFLLLGCLRGSFFAVKLNLETYRKTLLPEMLQPFFKNALGYILLLQIHKFKHGRDLKRIIDTYDFYILFGDPNRVELEYFIGKYKQHKLAYIPNSIPSVASALPLKEKRILWLSRLDYRQKHAELVIPLWKKLLDRLPDWHFDVVGYGDAFDALSQQIEVEKLARITLHGKQKADSFFSRSSIYVMTSSFEGFPNTLIEAQSYGAVPVVFRSYPVIDLIVNNENSKLVPTFDLIRMSDAIVELANDEAKREAMAQQALENARRFTIDRVGQQWMDFFDKHLPA